MWNKIFQIKIELSGSTRELKDLSNALKESSLSLQLSSQLLELSECLKRVESCKHEKKYVEAAETLQRIKSLLETPQSDLQMLSIHATMRIEYSSMYATFQNDVISLWDQCVSWKEARENGKESASLTIDCDRDEIQDLIKALHHVDSLKITLNDFSNKVVKYVIVPIINYDECSVYVVDERVFNVEQGDKKKKPSYQSVLHNLKLLMQFLHQHLDVEITNDQSFMVLLSDALLEPFSQKLIHDCISDTIPSSSAELENFEKVMNDINEFQDYLLKIGKCKYYIISFIYGNYSIPKKLGLVINRNLKNILKVSLVRINDFCRNTRRTLIPCSLTRYAKVC